MVEAVQLPRVFVSFARSDSSHTQAVRQLCEVLTSNGVNVRFDEYAESQLWPTWIDTEINRADYILVIASGQYRAFTDGEGPPDQGLGVCYEADAIRYVFYRRDRGDPARKVMPVLLPGHTPEELPFWLRPRAMRYYTVTDFTGKGVEDILRHVHQQPYLPPKVPGPVPTLATFAADEAARHSKALAVPGPIAAEFGRALLTFTGREAALREIADWLSDSDDRTSRFVTSEPGSGKTALLGLIAHLSGGSPQWVGPGLEDGCYPPERSTDVAIYARNTAPVTIVARLAQAAEMPAPEISAKPLSDGLSSLLDHLRERQMRMTVLLDALDEMSLPKEGEEVPSTQDLEDFANVVLRPLVGDEQSPIRFLLGGRKQVGQLAGFGLPSADSRVIDLDGTRYRDPLALRRWVTTVLRGQDLKDEVGQDRSSPWAGASDTDVSTAVSAIADIAKSSFYVGEAIARAQVHLAVLPDPRSASWVEQLPDDAGPAMRAELETRLGKDQPDSAASSARRALGLLLPLAYGRGDGIPWATVWLPLANSLRSEDVAPYSDADLEWIYRHASSYVETSPTGAPDRILFRLYHQSLGDFLRAGASQPQGRRDQAADERAIVRALLRGVPQSGDGDLDWAEAAGYTRAHLLEHAVAGKSVDDIDQLLLDPWFLANGPSAELRASLGNVTEPHHRAIADAYRSALAALSGRASGGPADPQTGETSTEGSRLFLAQLTLAARCRGVDALADKIQLGNGRRRTPWQAVWASWRQQPPHIRLTGFTDRVLAITTGTLPDGRVVAVTAGDDGGIRIWDVLDGSLVRTIPRAHAGCILVLASGSLRDGRKIVVSAGDDCIIRTWQLDTGDEVAASFTRHQAPVHGLALTQLNDRAAVLSGDADGIVRAWNPLTAQEVRKPYRHHLAAAVTAVAQVRLENTPHVVSAYDNGDVLMWNLASGSPAILQHQHSARAVRAVAVGVRDERPVIVSAGDDGEIDVWDPAGPASQISAPGPLAVHPDGIWALALAELDGRSAVVAAGTDRIVRVWDITDGTPIGAPFTGHAKTVRALAVTKAGNRTIVISGGDDPVPMVWDLVVAGTANEPFTGHQGRVRSLLFTHINGRRRLISGSSDATVRRWDPETGVQMGRPLEGHHQWVRALAVARIGGRECILSGGADTTVRIQDAASGEEVRAPLMHSAGVTSLLRISTGNNAWLVAACLDGTVRVWDLDDLETRKPSACYEGHLLAPEAQRTVRALCSLHIDPSEPFPMVVSAGMDGRLHVWRPASGETVFVEDSGHRAVTALADVPASPSWFASGGTDGMIRLHEFGVGGRHEQWSYRASSAVESLVIPPDSDPVVVVSAHADGTVQFWEHSTQQVVPYSAHRGRARALVVGSAGGRPAIFSGGDDELIRVWDAERKAPLRALHQGWVRALAVTASPDEGSRSGKWMVVSGGDDDTIRIRPLDWDVTQRENVLPARHRGVRALAASTTQPPVLVSGGVDKRLKVWDPFTGDFIGSLGSHEGWVRALATGTSPGTTEVVVSASGDGNVGIWDLRGLSRMGTLREAHASRVRAVGIGEAAFNDNRSEPVVVSGDTDGKIVVAGLLTGGRIGQPYTGHRSGIRALVTTSLAMTPIVISGDDDGVVLAWDLATREPAGQVPHGQGQVNAIAAQQRGYEGSGCTWVAVATGENVTVSSWNTEHEWLQRATVRFGCDVLTIAMPQESLEDEPLGRLVVGATQGIVTLEFASLI